MPRQSPALAVDGEVVVTEALDPAHLEDVATRLDRAEQATGTPLVDEAERDRITRVLAGGPPPSGWRPALAWRAAAPVGYLAVVTTHAEAIGDAATLLGADTGVVDASAGGGADRRSVLRALLVAASRLAAEDGADRVQVWTRRAGQSEVEVAEEVGFEVERRLGVLGRRLDVALPSAPASTARVRAYRPGSDDDAVVAVLAAAYAGTSEEGWDHDRFRARTRLPWFRAEDLLVAEPTEAGRGHAPPLAGLHWLKRRDERTGEVYNLAVHPRAQGQGVGPLLLHAGLAHLRAQGCDDVILWVDRANERAVSLYTGQGFSTRWDDLALGHTLAGDAPTR